MLSNKWFMCFGPRVFELAQRVPYEMQSLNLIRPLCFRLRVARCPQVKWLLRGWQRFLRNSKVFKCDIERSHTVVGPSMRADGYELSSRRIKPERMHGEPVEPVAPEILGIRPEIPEFFDTVAEVMPAGYSCPIRQWPRGPALIETRVPIAAKSRLPGARMVCSGSMRSPPGT